MATAVAALCCGTEPAAAQLVSCNPLVANQTCTVSTTAHTTITSATLPGVTVSAPNQQVLTNQLQAALADPNGATIQSQLGALGLIGPTSLSLISTQTTPLSSSSTQITVGPGTILIGPDQTVSFFVISGTTNTNTNTHTETFIHSDFQASQPLTAQGTNFLLGDLHTTFQTSMLDGASGFLGTLLSRGSEGGGVNLFSATPMAFAADTMRAATFEQAMAFAGSAPGVPQTVAMGNGWRAWLRGTHGRANFESTTANLGFRDRTASVEGGVERSVGNWAFGAAFGFGSARVTQDVTGDRGDIDTIRFGGHASYSQGPWSFTAALAGGFSKVDTLRLATLGVPTTAAYNATTVAAGGEAVRRTQIGNGRFEPLAGLVYTALRTGAFAETGGGALGLGGERAHVDALKGYIGGRIIGTASNLTPELRVRLLYDFLDDPRGYTARFLTDPTAAPIAVTGIKPKRFAAIVGGGVSAQIAPFWRAFVSYDAELRGHDVAHLAAGGFKGSW